MALVVSHTLSVVSHTLSVVSHMIIDCRFCIHTQHKDFAFLAHLIPPQRKIQHHHWPSAPDRHVANGFVQPCPRHACQVLHVAARPHNHTAHTIKRRRCDVGAVCCNTQHTHNETMTRESGTGARHQSIGIICIPISEREAASGRVAATRACSSPHSASREVRSAASMASTRRVYSCSWPAACWCHRTV